MPQIWEISLVLREEQQETYSKEGIERLMEICCNRIESDTSLSTIYEINEVEK